MKQNEIVSSLQVSLANFFIGFNIISNKYLINSVPIPVLLVLRYFFGALILFAFIFITQKERRFYLTKRHYTTREKFIYLLMALCGGSIFNSIYMFGMRHTTAIVTGMIGSTIPILIVFLSFLFLKQKLNKSHIISALFVAFGICILNLGHNVTISEKTSSGMIAMGNFIVFIAMIPEAMFTIFAKMLIPKVSPLMSALFINIINFFVCIPFFLFSLTTYNLKQITSFDVFLSFLIGLFSGSLFYSFYNSGITKISAQNAGLFTGIVPVSTAVLSLIFLNESFGVLSFVGMFFVLASIYIGVHATSEKALP